MTINDHLDERLAGIEKDVHYLRKDVESVKDDVHEMRKTVDSYPVVKMIAFGMAGGVLIAALGAVLGRLVGW